jgi:hypothetical protein
MLAYVEMGTTREQIAMGASKNHYHGSLNPKAQYQFEVPVEKVLSDYEVSYPLTRSMCAPIGDGGAAAILCSEDFLKSQPREIQKRAVKVLSCVMSAGKHRPVEEPGLSKWAADRAYQMARIEPQDIHVAEVHDATSFCEIYQVEMMGFEGFSAAIYENPQLVKALTIHVSQFYRNPSTFRAIQREAMPAILTEKELSGGRALRLWSVGCACGEEPYSLALLLMEMAPEAIRRYSTTI